MENKNIAAVWMFFCSLIFFIVSPVLGAAENTIVLGASRGWGAVEKRTRIDEIDAVRPHSVLTLSSAYTGTLSGGAGENPANNTDDILALYSAFRNFPAHESALDLAISFDEGNPEQYRDSQGRYRVSVTKVVQGVNERWARYGQGAVLFTGENKLGGTPVTITPSSSSALFAPGRNVRDFSIEFWLFPNTMENGEQIVAFTASGNQRIFCEAVRNKIKWTFQNIFAPPGASADTQDRLTVTLESRRTILPRSWSHHLIRYNADTGLLEYLVNGRIENMCHTTLNGREGGDVFTPFINSNGSFVLGSRFSGMLDEFRLYNKVINAPGHTALEQTSRTALELPELAKFSRAGGRFETRTIDLGEKGSVVHMIEVLGGRLGSAQVSGRGMAVKNIYSGKGTFRFPDSSAVQFFIRAGEEPYRFAQIPWVPVIPGQMVPGTIRGRYVQIAADFYPSGDCTTSPYLEELRIMYNRNDPPYPPSLVTARAVNGAVELSWRESPDENARGYLVYYGTTSGVYYGEGASLGGSPINAGQRTSLRIDGLKNGALYFFVVAAYDRTGQGEDGIHPGKFSREVSARPLKTGE